MDTIQAVSLLTLGVTFLAAYGVQFELLCVIGERWKLRPAPSLHIPAGFVFAAGISSYLSGLLP